MKVLRILGTRGIPAAHGGFETFAERLAVYLTLRGWRVTVYCQESGSGPVVEDEWLGVHRVRIPVAVAGPQSTIVFDWKATRHAARSPGMCLTLGYATAGFCALLRMARVPNAINMDGIEWRRSKWGPAAKVWLILNEWAALALGNHLIADNPEIERHLARVVPRAKITTIPYGADRLLALPYAPVIDCGLQPRRYLTLIARPEPENSVLEIVQAFSMRPRGVELAVLGAYADDNPYHRAVRAAAGDEVRFLGPIYDTPVVQALRFHSLAYLHGHRVGGTNPSLVEALGAGNAVIARNNRFNRWVVGDGGRYFKTAAELDEILSLVLGSEDTLRAMAAASIARFECAFTWPSVLRDYEALLSREF